MAGTLHRRTIADSLKRELVPQGWEIRSRVNGKIVGIPPQSTTVEAAKALVDAHVRKLGYVPEFTQERAGNGSVKLRFHTKETLEQKGEGGTTRPRVNGGTVEQRIIEWHERILKEALQHREKNPGFTFNLRTTDISGQNRLSKGYWFTGSNYLFFAPFRPNDQNNKTKSIGFVILFNQDGSPSRSYLEVVFGALRPLHLVDVHKDIVTQLGQFDPLSNNKYQRRYEGSDVIKTFHTFLEHDLPIIRDLIDKSGYASDFLVSEAQFADMYGRIKSIRDNGGRLITPPLPAPIEVKGDGPVNMILYGPPGTGKTHWLRQKFLEYTDQRNHVDKDTWLQDLLSGYGWRPVLVAAMAHKGGKLRVPEITDHEWLRAKAIQKGRNPKKINSTIWAFLQEHTPPHITTVGYKHRREPFVFEKLGTGEWVLVRDWQDVDPDSAALLQALNAGPTGDTSPVKRYRLATFHPSYSYEDFIRGIRPVIPEEGGEAQFRMVDGIFKRICDEARANPSKRYAFFIDEINRANIAKVFGELITLIEPDKRAHFDKEGSLTRGLAVHLPGSEDELEDEPFGVPANLDIYGTMNTADRSIALLDVALRRRFIFQEMPPNYATIDRDIGGVNLASLLRRINDRLEYLLDRDHTIGHAYFINITTIADLANVFALQILPLLQEYFFDNFERLALVVATTDGASAMVKSSELAPAELFTGMSNDWVTEPRTRFSITSPATWTADTFKGIYTT